MGTFNILSASIQGKIGTLYGVKQKKAHVIKAIPFSHAPHNENQTKSVRAFEKLNRLAGGISKIAFDYLNLSDKEMLKHNAVAKWLKPIIADKTFQPQKINEIIQEGTETNISKMELNYDENTITIKAESTEQEETEENKNWFIFIFDDNGYVIEKDSPRNKEIEKTIRTQLIRNREYYAIAFRADKQEKDFNIFGLSFVTATEA